MSPDGKVSLLIAEDDPQIRYLMVAAAERAGCFGAITAVEDGEKAWRAVQPGGTAGHPDLIVSDLSMPRMSGIDLIRALKADPATRSIPVAIITSSNIPNDRVDAHGAGASVFEPKPHGLEALTRLLGSIRQRCAEAMHSS